MKTKKAAALPAAGKSTLRIEPYQKSQPLSSLKLQIGKMLLFRDNQQKYFWKRFETNLRQYITVKRTGRQI